MTTFNESITRIRRFIRDPDGDIWDDETIRLLFNDAQLEISTKINFIERVHAYKYPPMWTWSYQRDWEFQHIAGDKYQCLHNWAGRDIIISYPWEPGYYLDTNDTADDGTRFIHPWEVVYCSPADVVKIPIHAKFHKGRFAAFDEIQIEPISEKELGQSDSYYKTTSGVPNSYYRANEYDNVMVLYPRPSGVTWDEYNLFADTPGDSFSDTLGEGIITHEEDSLDESDEGIIYDTIDTEDHLFMIFQAIPDDIEEGESSWDDEIKWWPAYMIPIIEYATLERCFGADTDGFIPSLRDYWEARKKIGIETIKLFKQKRLMDRDYQMGGRLKPIRSVHPRLPSGYPAQWP